MESLNIRNVFSRSLIFRAVSLWVGLCILAYGNGALREIVLKPIFNLSEPTANQISCVTGVLLWTVFTIWFWKPLRIKTLGQTLLVGFGWFFATLLFETFVVGRNLNLTQIIAAYDLSNGQYWGLVLLWIGIMPLVLFYLLGFRHYINNWGATDFERVLPINGVELLRSPRIESTHALTVQTNPENIWPWLIQMGEGRGGFYSYSWLENLVGCKIKNAAHIIPRFQNLKRNDSISLHSKAPKLKVTVFDVNQTLAFEGWIFHLEKMEKNKTRLMSRIYTEAKPEMGFLYNFIMTSFLFDFVHFIMSRKQLLTIKRLCESKEMLLV